MNQQANPALKPDLPFRTATRSYFFLPAAGFLAPFADFPDFAEDFFLTATDAHLRSGLFWFLGCRGSVIRKRFHCLALSASDVAFREIIFDLISFFRSNFASHVRRLTAHAHDGPVPAHQKPTARGYAPALSAR